MTTVLVTGSAGFIGFHTAQQLLKQGYTVIGVDNFNDYYDQQLKEDRNALLETHQSFRLYRGDLQNIDFVRGIFSQHKIDKICHLAAQAGIRYSLVDPHAYIAANIVGFTNIINEAKNFGVKDFVYASSSSVYGGQSETPFHEDQSTDAPLSLYAATKKSNEVIAYTYHRLYNMNCTGLRFFTVYGPYGRPDMAMISFSESILQGKTINLFNYGKMKRDFTYIDDIVDGVCKCIEHPFSYEIINLGNNNPVELMTMVTYLEQGFGKTANKDLLPLQPGEAVETCANIEKAKQLLDWEPQVPFDEGIEKFITWYKEYYKII